MKQVDVLIVGGGPAGSTLAWALRDSGLRIAILDKQNFPRDKVCAGWVTPAVMEELQIDLADYAKEHTLQPISGFRVSQLGKKQIETHYQNNPISYGIRRCEFDHYLLQRCGAELLLGQAFKSMQQDDGVWLINDDIKARLVVGAGGHFCPVARAIGARLGRHEQVVAAQEIEFQMTPQQQQACQVEEQIPELFFTPDLTGYGWVFRKGDFLNIGLGREDNHKLSEHVQDFCQFLKKQGKIPPDTPEKFHGHAYLLYPHALRDVIKDGLLLIGDAAGLAYPQSGEGIRPAVESALLAAKVIRNCHEDFSQTNLRPYYELLVTRFGERQPKPGLMERLPLGFKQILAGKLMQTHWFTRHFVMDRWFLHRQQAPLPSQVGRDPSTF
jgi:geranylgeranyl reductase family protein